MTAERFKPDLDGILPAGGHGFHLHENPDCGDGGLAAGGHYDPENTGFHAGPYGDGHLGALPRLESDGGRVTAAVVAPRLTIDDVFGRALVIHEGGDNYFGCKGGELRFGVGAIWSCRQRATTAPTGERTRRLLGSRLAAHPSRSSADGRSIRWIPDRNGRA